VELFNKKRGATLIEFAIIFPFFILFVFLIIYVVLIWNAKLSMQSSISNGVRLAFTRGNSSIVGQNIIPDIAAYAASGSMNTRLAGLLSTPEEAPFADAYYKSMSLSIFNRSFESLPPRYIYAMVYTMQGLTAGVGEGLMRFPCDPTLPVAVSQGCVQCRFLHPVTRDDVPGNPQMGTPDFDWNYLGIKCVYRPSNVFVGPVHGLLGFILPSSTFNSLLVRARGSFYVQEIVERPL
jgi:hypothetical protein